MCVAYSRKSPEQKACDTNTTTLIQTVDFPLDLYSGGRLRVLGVSPKSTDRCLLLYDTLDSGVTSDERMCEITEDVWWRATRQERAVFGADLWRRIDVW